MCPAIPPTNPTGGGFLIPGQPKSRTLVELPIRSGNSTFNVSVPEDFATTYTKKHCPGETYTPANFRNEFDNWKSGPIDWQDFIHSDEKVKAGFYLLDNYSQIHASLEGDADKKILAKIGKEFTMF